MALTLCQLGTADTVEYRQDMRITPQAATTAKEPLIWPRTGAISQLIGSGAEKRAAVPGWLGWLANKLGIYWPGKRPPQIG